jgi:AcrR family transcriptional regulator
VAKGARRKRLSREEGRQLLLDAGRELVHEQPVGWPLEHVRVTDVAGRVGVSVGMLYHYWETQEDYRSDLLEELFSPQRYPPTTVPDLFDTLGGGDRPIEELVRLGTEVEFRALRDNPELRLLMATWAADDPVANPKIAAQYDAVAARWASVYEMVFDAYGLEIRPPFTFATMAAMVIAMGEGLAVRASLDPASVPDDLERDPAGDGLEQDDPEQWGLLGCAFLALLPALSRPKGSQDDLWAHVERVARLEGADGDGQG